MKTMISFFVLLLMASTAWSQSACVDMFDNKTLEWPESLQALDFEVLSGFMRNEINTIGLKRDPSVKRGKVAWVGQQKIKNLYVGQSDIPERFTKTMLDYHNERDRDVMDVAIMTLTHLGMDMAVEKLIHHPSVKMLILKSQSLKKQVDQKTITKAQLKAQLAEILSLVSGLSEGRQAMFLSQNELDQVAVQSIQKIVNGYYQRPSIQSDKDLMALFAKHILWAQEQGFRVWLKNNEMTIGTLSDRIQSYLEQTSEANMALDIRDEIIVERIQSALEIAFY